MAWGFVLFLAGVHMPAANPNAGLSRSQAAQHLGVPASTVSMWALQGWTDRDGIKRTLTVVGRQGRQRLYRYQDLLDAEADTARHPNSRRGATRRTEGLTPAERLCA